MVTNVLSNAESIMPIVHETNDYELSTILSLLRCTKKCHIYIFLIYCFIKAFLISMYIDRLKLKGFCCIQMKSVFILILRCYLYK